MILDIIAWSIVLAFFSFLIFLGEKLFLIAIGIAIPVTIAIVYLVVRYCD